MSDNVLVTQGTGTTISTNDISGVHYQNVKLVDGTSGSTTSIAGDASGLKVQLGRSETLSVTGVVPGVAATSLGKASDAGYTTSHVGILTLAVRNVSHTTLVNAELDYCPINVDAEGCVVIVGNVAHDAVDSDPPVKVGGKALSVQGGAVAANDRVNAYFDLAGRLVTLPYEAQANIVSGSASATGTASTTIITGVASTFLDVSTIIVHNSGTTDSYITIQNGSAGATLAVIPAPAKGGAVVPFHPPLRVTTSGNGLFFAAGLSSSTVFVTANAIKNLV
jgi:hypothetical protein